MTLMRFVSFLVIPAFLVLPADAHAAPVIMATAAGAVAGIAVIPAATVGSIITFGFSWSTFVGTLLVSAFSPALSPRPKGHQENTGQVERRA